MAPKRSNKRTINKSSFNNSALLNATRRHARTSAPPEGQRRSIHRSSLQQCPGCYQLFSSHRRLNDHRFKTRNARCSLQSRYRIDVPNNGNPSPTNTRTLEIPAHNEEELDISPRFECDFDMDHNVDYDEFVDTNSFHNLPSNHTLPGLVYNESASIASEGSEQNVVNQQHQEYDSVDFSDDVSCEFALDMMHCQYSDDEVVEECSCEMNNDDTSSQSSYDSDGTFMYDCTKEKHYSHTVEEECYVELLTLLDSFDHPPPLKTFDLILEWCQGSYYKGFKFQDAHPSRRTFINSLKQKFGMKPPKNKPLSPSREPQVKWVAQEGYKDGTYSVAFDAKCQLESLLNDTNLMVPSNMVLNDKNPFHVYKSRGPVDEVLDGSWYRHATKNYQPCDFCVPVIIFLDKTGGDKQNQRYPVFPIVMTTALFNRSTRNSPSAWRHLGFVSNSDVFQSKAQKRTLKQGASVRNLHLQLDAVFDSLYNLQSEGHWFPLRIGEKVKKMRLWFPICLILGDGQQGDDNTGRYSSHCKGIRRISRFCYCQQTECADTEKKCKFIKQDKMKALIMNGTDQELQEKSQHRCNLTFFRADFGNDIHGIFSIQPPCLQHTVAEGMVEYLLENFTQLLKPWQKSAIDECVYPWLRGIRQTVRSLYPTCNFVTGITSVTLVSADEKIGLLFSYALLASSKSGRKILLEKPSSRVHNDITDTIYKEYLHMFEAILCLEHTLARTEIGFWSLRDASEGERELSNAINRLVTWLVQNCPREKGNGWALAKVHEIRDFPRHITRSGCPSNFNAAIGESLLRPMGKHFIPNAQFRRKEFCMQLAWRASEQAVTQMAASKYTNFVNYNPRKSREEWEYKVRTYKNLIEDSEKQLSYNTINATKLVFRINGNNQLNTSIFTRSKSKKMILEKNLEETIATYMRDKGFDDLLGYFELTINNCIYRCHPDHCSKGPWYDWAMVDFEKRNGLIEDVPCKILLFLENRLHDRRDPHSSPFIAVAHCCHFGHTQSSVLFRRWKLQYQRIGRGRHKRYGAPILNFISANSIKEHAYCFEEFVTEKNIVPKDDCETEILQTLPRHEWAGFFYNKQH